jgi:hypothetical protein
MIIKLTYAQLAQAIADYAVKHAEVRQAVFARVHYNEDGDTHPVEVELTPARFSAGGDS